VAFCRWAVRRGLSRSQVAACLGLSPRTLRHWQAGWQRERLRVRGRGRPAGRSDRQQRNRALALIDLLGPRVGVPTLQALCPDMPRREVQDLLRRYRRVWRKRQRRLARILEWTRPGAVWAIDFAQPPRPLEGCFPRLLAVRDLASGHQLLWLPVPDETGQTAAAALEGLFREHGAPLVLKSDNGSAFRVTELEALLSRWDVWQLFSPPGLPRYNGSCEAGIGSMKTRTHHQASRAGRPGEWTCDDVEAARLQANQTARPWGVGGPVPEQRWQGRQPLPEEERGRFTQAVQRLEQEARQEQGYAGATPLSHLVQAAVNRVALQRALVAHGLLRFRSEQGQPR
jgi:hypothetical protein